MKRIRPLLSGLVACGIAFAMVMSASADTAQQGMAKVVSIKGSARFMSSPNGNWQPLKTGMTLKTGAILQTAANSYIDLILNDSHAKATSMGGSSSSAGGEGSGIAYQPKSQQDAVRVFENTVLGIDKLTIDQTGVDTITETQFDLKAGSVFGMVKKLSAGSKYEVKIPNGVAGIRGTVYYVTSTGIVRVISGSVVIAYVGAGGAVRTVEVKAGFEFDIRSGPDAQPTPMSTQEILKLKPAQTAFTMTKGQATINVPVEAWTPISTIKSPGPNF
jgi:hypothetical protein